MAWKYLYTYIIYNDACSYHFQHSLHDLNDFFSTMIELLGKEVEREVNVDFNEVFQRMTLDAIGQLIL